MNKQVTFNFCCFILENIVVYSHTLRTLQEGLRFFSGFAGQPRRNSPTWRQQKFAPVFGSGRENFEKTSDSGKQSEGPGGDDDFQKTCHEEGLFLWALLQLLWLPESLAHIWIHFHIWDVMDSNLFQKSIFSLMCSDVSIKIETYIEITLQGLALYSVGSTYLCVVRQCGVQWLKMSLRCGGR